MFNLRFLHGWDNTGMTVFSPNNVPEHFGSQAPLNYTEEHTVEVPVTPQD